MKKYSTPEIRQKPNVQNDPDSDEAPLKPKVADKVKNEFDKARERSWQAVKRRHEEANKKEEASATIGKIIIIFYTYGLLCKHNLLSIFSTK